MRAHVGGLDAFDDDVSKEMVLIQQSQMFDTHRSSNRASRNVEFNAYVWLEPIDAASRDKI